MGEERGGSSRPWAKSSPVTGNVGNGLEDRTWVSGIVPRDHTGWRVGQRPWDMVSPAEVTLIVCSLGEGERLSQYLV